MTNQFSTSPFESLPNVEEEGNQLSQGRLQVKPKIQNDFDPFNDPLFEATDESKQLSEPKQQKPSSSFDPFDDVAFEEPEGKIKSALRTMAQVPLGLAQAGTFFMDLILLSGMGEIYDEEEISRIETLAKQQGVKFDREVYLDAAGKQFQTFPTVSNIARMVEETTGAPLVAKTDLQKSVNFGSTITGFLPKALASFSQRALVGTGISGVEQILESKGVPRAVAEPVSSLLIGKVKPGEVPAKISVTPKTKPSGLTERRFEKSITKPTHVSSKKIEKIDAAIEKDFIGIQEKIVEASPLGETKAQLRDNLTFKAESREAFKDVQKLAEEIPGTFDSNIIRKDLSKKVNKKTDTGFGPSEYNKAYNASVKDILKDSPKTPVTASQAVAKFRSNNKELGEIYEVGKSGAWNRGKKDALLDHNRSIADAMESKYPKSEFVETFKKSNDQWSKINDIEAIDKFTDSLFKGEIKFEKGQKWLDKHGMRDHFKRALGEKGFNQYEQLLNDLMTMEKSRSLMKKAESKGFGGYFKHHLLWKLSPNLGKSSLVVKGGKEAYRKVWEGLLDKPQYTLQYSQGINAAKAGNYEAADKIFKDLEVKILGKEAANSLSNAEEKAEKAKTKK